MLVRSVTETISDVTHEVILADEKQRPTAESVVSGTLVDSVVGVRLEEMQLKKKTKILILPQMSSIMYQSTTIRQTFTGKSRKLRTC